MRKSSVALLLLVGAAAIMMASAVYAQGVDNHAVARTLRDLRNPGLRTNAVAVETVFIGHSHTNHTVPNNYWNVYTGPYRPGTSDPSITAWDWDNFTGLQHYTDGATDSLQGFWPVRSDFISFRGPNPTDDQRLWFGSDMGNQINYVLNVAAQHKRSFGVNGLWHADKGKNQPGGSAVQWTPLSGSQSLWCGLRQMGDNSVMDPLTGNPFNATTYIYNHNQAGPVGWVGNFPGYPDQID